MTSRFRPLFLACVLSLMVFGVASAQPPTIPVTSITIATIDASGSTTALVPVTAQNIGSPGARGFDLWINYDHANLSLDVATSQVGTDMADGVNYVIPTHSSLTTGAYTCTAVTAGAALSARAIGASIAPTYIATLPVDPSLAGTATADTYTGYYIQKSAAGRIKVGACHESAYADASIAVQR